MSQKDKIKLHLLSGQTITAGEALLVYGCFRLAARIKELRADGFNIVTIMKTDANRKSYASYKLKSSLPVDNNPLNESLRELHKCRIVPGMDCDCDPERCTGCEPDHAGC
jgi:hypothetical protein